MHQQGIAAGIDGRAKAARVFPGKVHVVVVPYVADNLPAEETLLAFVQGIHFLEYLRDTVRLQLWKCNRRE